MMRNLGPGPLGIRRSQAVPWAAIEPAQSRGADPIGSQTDRGRFRSQGSAPRGRLERRMLEVVIGAALVGVSQQEDLLISE